MPSLTNAVRYGGQYASIGYSLGGPVGAGIGAGVGILGGLFSKDDEEIRAERYRQFMDALERSYRDERDAQLAANSGAIAQSTAGAGARALAAGRGGAEAERYIRPAVQSAIHEGNVALRNVGQYYTGQRLQAEADYANRPIEPNALDYLGEAGGAAANMFQDERFLKALEAYGTPFKQSPGTEKSAWGGLDIPPAGQGGTTGKGSRLIGNLDSEQMSEMPYYNSQSPRDWWRWAAHSGSAL